MNFNLILLSIGLVLLNLFPAQAWNSNLHRLSRFSSVSTKHLQVRKNGLTMTTIGIVPNSLDITARDFELTPPLRERIEGKIGKVLSKLSAGGVIRSAHVVLRVLKFPVTEHHTHISKKDSQIVEVTVRMKGGVVINVSEKTEDMYASIDLVSHKLAQTLKKHNAKLKEHKGTSGHEEISSVLFFNGQDTAIGTELESFDEEELLVDLDKKYKDYVVEKNASVPSNLLDMSVVRPKVFPMPPISLSDAVVCLQFVDHPFYVFRNKV